MKLETTTKAQIQDIKDNLTAYAKQLADVTQLDAYYTVALEDISDDEEPCIIVNTDPNKWNCKLVYESIALGSPCTKRKKQELIQAALEEWVAEQ